MMLLEEMVLEGKTYAEEERSPSGGYYQTTSYYTIQGKTY
jgi:hypothetical protein